jgi:hypothetical protein
MKPIAYSEFNSLILKLIREFFDGAQDASQTMVVSPGSDSGFFGTLGEISAETASRSVSKSGSTIAAHINHMRYSLELANKYLRGENPYPDSDIPASWNVKQVNETDWRNLISSLRKEYDTLHQALEQKPDWSNVALLTDILSHVTHTAYHLGAVRQLAIIT